ncbi:MAG: hypothetical protein L0170_09915 [Acidobacteria bacterium]|nr:hypothetical protein [Acidobacteriota bacterium]
MRSLGSVIGSLLLASTALAQQTPPPGTPDHQHLEPGEALRLLHEAQALMERSEALLSDSSRGKAAETESAILARIQTLLKDDAGAAQKQILEKIRMLLEKSESSRKDAIKRMARILKDAKT